MEKIFGIDLGTTNSEIAYYKDGKPTVITIENGLKYMPSAVGIDASGGIVTGLKARNQYAAFPENTVMSVKRLMGSGKTVTMAGKNYTPAQISAEILKTLKQAAENESGLEVKKVVITVPAYFTDLQRKETIEAGELAGLEVARIINEPTAAALAYGGQKNKREHILVYDLGGGTFDISLIDVEEGITEVLASDGNSRLGGDDFDRELEELFRSYLPTDLRRQNDLKLDARLKSKAEEVKIALSTQSRLEVKEEFIATDDGKPVHLECSVSREDFARRIDDKLKETGKLLDDVLKAAKLEKEKIDRVVLVGGSTFIPAVSDLLGRQMGFDVHREVDPTYCVAMGAAIQGAIISGEEVESILVDVCSHSLGISCLDVSLGYFNDDYYSIVIHRNTPIPASMTKNYHTAYPGQKAIEINAYQGENPTASNNTPLGSFELDGLPEKLPAQSEIEVTFRYNLNGIVEISALERQSKRKKKLKVDIHRLDAKDDENKTPSRRQVERILKKAEKKRKKIDDPQTLSLLDEKIEALTDAREAGEPDAMNTAAGELAEFIAQI
jgi:molecular chaperone DnaK